jgi:hypothetical protein
MFEARMTKGSNKITPPTYLQHIIVARSHHCHFEVPNKLKGG